MIEIERYLMFLEFVLTAERLQHPLGVQQVLENLAGTYSLDVEQAKLAGLLHDAAKDMAYERQVVLAVEEVSVQYRDVGADGGTHELVRSTR